MARSLFVRKAYLPCSPYRSMHGFPADHTRIYEVSALPGTGVILEYFISHQTIRCNSNHRIFTDIPLHPVFRWAKFYLHLPLSAYGFVLLIAYLYPRIPYICFQVALHIHEMSFTAKVMAPKRFLFYPPYIKSKSGASAANTNTPSLRFENDFVSATVWSKKAFMAGSFAKGSSYVPSA